MLGGSLLDCGSLSRSSLSCGLINRSLLAGSWLARSAHQIRDLLQRHLGGKPARGECLEESPAGQMPAGRGFGQEAVEQAVGDLGRPDCQGYREPVAGIGARKLPDAV